jgi:hypothetical protein
VHQYARKALDYLNELRTPDDSVPFFNDSVNGIAPDRNELNKHAETIMGYHWVTGTNSVTAICSLEPSGYSVVRDRSSAMIIDCGEIGPDYQPGHAHCDTLSYEFFLNGSKLITNCGNYEYAVGERRSVARRTQAHNTVKIDNQEQSEVWSAFRVGARARPVRSRLSSTADNGAYFVGSHDGYLRLKPGVVHEREITYRSGGSFSVVDRILGAGKHEAASFIHFVIGIELKIHDGRIIASGPDGSELATFEPIESDSYEIAITERYPEFGLNEFASTAILLRTAEAPFAFGYRVYPAPLS